MLLSLVEKLVLILRKNRSCALWARDRVRACFSPSSSSPSPPPGVLEDNTNVNDDRLLTTMFKARYVPYFYCPP